MSSEESDDEPLSVLATFKKLNPTEFPEPENETRVKKRKKKTKKPSSPKKLTPKLRDLLSPPEIQRPADVWLYMKDFNQNGPYSCLLCAEWFINRSKIIVHYILNHNKDFCGICRYFVPDRAAWLSHTKFHIPWACSQCTGEFDTEEELREHFSLLHKLVHCRLCHFRMSDNEEYNRHLYDKHNMTNMSAKTVEVLWEVESDGLPKYHCVLCAKSNNSSNFFNHYMCYHRITLKCFSKMISGCDPPFSVYGANISVDFLESQLKEQDKFGYIDFEAKPVAEIDTKHQNPKTEVLLDALVPEIKQERTSDSEEVNNRSKKKTKEQVEPEEPGIWNTYQGVVDFDITSTEIIMLESCYYSYISELKTCIDSKIMPEQSDIDYEGMKPELDIICPVCTYQFNTATEFTSHMYRMHNVKAVPSYFCRVCATTFDTLSELKTHTMEELSEFEDLWICQFCDKEFDSRVDTREHLTQHWTDLELDNCFSPHLGFKCRYCPTLFWNETDREGHQKRVHFAKRKEDFYKCGPCSELFSDKVWFIHHYMERHMKETNVRMLLKCLLCALVFPSVETMRAHFSTEHTEAQKIFCSLGTCAFKPFAQKKSFKIHVKSVHKPGPRESTGKVNCQLCGREFDSVRACNCHMTQVHGPGRFKCKLCHTFLNTADERKLHYLLQHPGRHHFDCTICGKSFPYKSSLYSHRNEHNTDRRPFTCTYCNKTFMKKDSFREHVLIHEGPRHACSYCPMRFVQRSNMLRHERRHTGERPYSCHYCNATFSDKGACSSHMRTHSRDTSYPCVYCGQTFVQKSKLKYHVRKHTGENLETCSICSKIFTSGCALREHMKVHAKNKNAKVACPMCKKYFEDERYMMRHLRSTHHRDGYRCPICGKKLASSFGLRQHVITHSSLKTFKCTKCPKSFAVKRSALKHIRRRHNANMQGNEENIGDFIRTLDVRECQLGLDEDILTSIFGPRKKLDDDVLLEDTVTFPEHPPMREQMTPGNESKSDEESDDSSSSDDGQMMKPVEVNIEVKVEPESETEPELEPTDFVSVKVEPMDDESEE